MVAEAIAATAAVLVALAELLHQRRLRVVAPLAFGPRKRPELWTMAAPFLRVIAVGAMTWGLLTLLELEPKVHEAEGVAEGDIRHVVIVLDVSPSMRLQDAGPSGKQSRMDRAADVLESFFLRVAIEQYRISVIAFYTGAKPVVIDTRDIEVVRNILNDLPMHFAFKAGKTDLFAGLEEAVRVARPWNPNSTTMILVSDGDTVPAQGMPTMPASVADVVVVGVGDPHTGTFIDGRQSRQDVSTLRQIATRLRGVFHNGNEKHLSTALLAQLTQSTKASAFDKLTRREYALAAIGLGAVILALLPLLLHLFGTRWKAGVPAAVQGAGRQSLRATRSTPVG